MPDKFEEELAKAAGQVAIETARDARGVLGRIFGDAITELGAGLGETIRQWRLKNLFKTVATAQRLCEEQGIPLSALRALPLGDAVRVIQSASMEEEEDVQLLWAQLMANASNPATGITVKKHFVDILQSLGAAEAALLDLLFVAQISGPFRVVADVEQFNRTMADHAERGWRTFPEDVRRAAAQNLVRLRCVTFRPRPIDMQGAFRDEARRLAVGDNRPFPVLDPRRLEGLVKQLLELIFAAAGVQQYQQSAEIPVLMRDGRPAFNAHFDFPEANYILTDLGIDLMKACTAPATETDAGGA